MLRLTTLALALAGSLTGFAAASDENSDDSPRAIAEAWIEAYSSQDFDGMTALMTEETVFVDPTSFDIAMVTDRIDWQGPAAITAGVGAWGMNHGRYTIARTYEASGRVIFNGHIDVIYGEGEEAQAFRYPITTIITVEGGHVTEHRDYTDFNGASRITAPR
ncbi:nuclear transport factor 2 family protein [Maricaulis sp.]|uniref:nuclear transport factor 2 family protein n=1 Tax=Maricaulis sp. TaxID=1486257 RepID=UPI002B2724B9|nr:nuclear transport factor 2 family protein [Maricaulis sp.]